MKTLLVLLALLLLTTLYFVFPLLRAIMQNREMAEATPYEQHPNEPNMNILVAGDSTGVGTGASEARASIAGRIGQDLPNADITNISENGLTLAGLNHKLMEHKGDNYDLIVLQIGANDVVGISSIEKILPKLKPVLELAETKGKKVILITAGNIGLCPIFRWPISTYITKRTLAVREIFINETKQRDKVNYVDLFEPAETDMFNTDVEKYYGPDKFHPSGEGYGIWYEKVRKFLPINN